MLSSIIQNVPIAKIDLHTHTNFCDGKSSAEEMVLAAIDKGLEVLGIVTHAHVEFEPGYNIHPSRVPEFQREVKALAQKYEGKIKVLCGVEADPVSNMSYEGFSYVLGSSHYFGKPDDMRSVDASPERLARAIDELFCGDVMAASESYYGQLVKVAELKPDVIGHFDLVTKFNERIALIDEQAARYRCAWQAAADELLKLRVPFEINTGAISRGWRTTPYPSSEIMAYLEARGAKFVLSSDAHRAENVAFGFDKF